MTTEEFIAALKHRLTTHHCCRWGESALEHPENALRGYCGYELEHGLEMDSVLLAIEGIEKANGISG